MPPVQCNKVKRQLEKSLNYLYVQCQSQVQLMHGHIIHNKMKNSHQLPPSNLALLNVLLPPFPYRLQSSSRTNFYLCKIDVSNVELKIISLQPSSASIICPLLFLVNFCDKQLTQFPKTCIFSYSEIGNSHHKKVVYENGNVSFQLSCCMFNLFKDKQLGAISQKCFISICELAQSAYVGVGCFMVYFFVCTEEIGPQMICFQRTHFINC